MGSEGSHSSNLCLYIFLTVAKYHKFPDLYSLIRPYSRQLALQLVENESLSRYDSIPILSSQKVQIGIFTSLSRVLEGILISL